MDKIVFKCPNFEQGNRPKKRKKGSKLMAEKIQFLQKLTKTKNSEYIQEFRTGWKTGEGLKGGANSTEPQPNNNKGEKEKGSNNNDSLLKQNITLAYQNVNGMSIERKEEIEEFMEDNKVDIMCCAEVKKQQGDLLSNHNINGYYLSEELRPDMQEGGLSVYIKEDLNITTEPWEGLVTPDDDWMRSERNWLILKSEVESFAICSVYLRCLNFTRPEHYERNSELMDKISEESRYLRTMGSAVFWWGNKLAKIHRSAQYQTITTRTGV